MATVVQELEGALAAVARLTHENAEAAAKIVEGAKAFDAFKTEMETKLSVSAATIATLTEQATALTTERDALKADVEAKTKALANPAFAAAAAEGDKSAVKEGGSEASPEKTKAEYRAEYDKIEDPMQRALYRNAHKVEMGL